MCGLFGSTSVFLSDSEVDDTMALGFLSRFRGKDATGIGVLGKKNDKGGLIASVHKEAVPSGTFIESEETRKFLSERSKPTLILGHTRAATGGALTKLNAQPFQIKHIIGAHNGMMDVFKDTESEPGNQKSDSLLFYEHLAEEGVRKALEKGSKSNIFAYALTWLDTKNKTLNFLRNKERPLWLTTSSNGATTYWASELLFLEFMDRKSTAIFSKAWSIDIDTLYTFDLNKRKMYKEPLVVPKHYPVIKSFTPLYGTPWDWAENDPNAPWEPEWKKDLRSWDDRREAAIRNRDSRKSDKKRNKGKNQPPIDNVIVLNVENNKFEVKDDSVKTYSYFGFKEKKFTLPEILPVLHSGCYCCNSVARPQDHVWWRSEVDYLCDDCHSLPWMKEMETGPISYSDLFTKSKIAVALKK